MKILIFGGSNSIFLLKPRDLSFTISQSSIVFELGSTSEASRLHKDASSYLGGGGLGV